MPKIKASSVNLHYITVGMGPDIVMLHGFLGNLAVWHLDMAPILRREYRVTTYDLRGHGYSDVTPLVTRPVIWSRICVASSLKWASSGQSW